MVEIIEKEQLDSRESGLKIADFANIAHDCRLITHADWLEARKNGIGGSDVAAILGLSAWTSETELWLNKTGRLPDDDETSEVMEWGTALEPVIRGKFAEKHPKDRVFVLPFMLRSKAHPCMQADLDGLVCRENGKWEILEIKTAAAFKANAWGTDENPEIPAYYQTQAMHYMSVSGINRVTFAVLIGGNRYIERSLNADPDFLNALPDIEETFWDKVVSDTRPETDGSKASSDYANRFKGGDEAVLNLDNMADDLDGLRLAKDKEDTVKKEVALYENRIKEAMGDHNVATINGVTIKWKPQSKTMVDSKALKEKYPNIYDEVSKTSSSRPFKPVI